MQKMIKLPQGLYDAVRKQAVAQQKTPDDLVVEWVSERLQELESSEIIQAFEQEVAAFERLKPTLIEMYPGQYVAIYLGEVIGTGDEKLALLEQMREQFGNLVCYIEKVSLDSPRTMRMPSIRVARS
jgi:hypothetical protein